MKKLVYALPAPSFSTSAVGPRGASLGWFDSVHTTRNKMCLA